MNRIHKLYNENKLIADEKERDCYLDNVRFIMMIFVVAGHFINKVGLEKYQNLFMFIYIFHMPCFVFLSGYFAKAVNKGGRFRVEKILSVFWLYFLMKLVNLIILRCFGVNTTFRLFYESGAPWYLICLAAWYIMIPFIHQVNAKVMMVLSLAAALAAGYDTSINYTFSFSRLLVFFPFFLLGYYCSKDMMKKFRGLKLKLPALILLMAVFTIILFYGRSFKSIQGILYGALYYKKSFPNFYIWGSLIRLLWYITAFIISAAVMLIIPRCRMFFSKMGQRTLQIYLLHYWIRTILTQAGFFVFITQDKIRAIAVLPFTVLLTFILGIEPLMNFFASISLQRLFIKFTSCKRVVEK